MLITGLCYTNFVDKSYETDGVVIEEIGGELLIVDNSHNVWRYHDDTYTLTEGDKIHLIMLHNDTAQDVIYRVREVD